MLERRGRRQKAQQPISLAPMAVYLYNSRHRLNMTAEYPSRVWFNPPKFWASTRFMNKEDAAALFEHIYLLAEQGDFDTLAGYDFIEIGNPYRKPARSAGAQRISRAIS